MNETEIRQALQKALEAQRAGMSGKAGALYREVLRRAGEQPVALNALGMQALAVGAFQEAAALFRRAVEVDPQAADLWMNLATACRRQDDTAGERSALERALACDQRHFMASVRLAELWERTGETGRAAERWSGVLQMAAQMSDPPPALAPLLAHAREVVGSQQRQFGIDIDMGLEAFRMRQAPGERRRIDAGIEHLLGRRAIYANVCAGFHIPFLPADEFFERKQFPWLERVEAASEVVRAELMALLACEEPGFSPYVAMASGTPANKWSALDHRADWSALHLWKNGVRDDVACGRCPETTALMEAAPLARIPGRAPTVFFSILQPGTHLPAHTGVTNMRTIVHLPLVVPDGCGLRVGGETRHWRLGEALAFDDTIEHEAWNHSDSLRAVLIFDIWNPHLTEAEQEMLCAFFPLADRAGVNPLPVETD